MTRTGIGVLTAATLLCGGWLLAQGPGPFLPPLPGAIGDPSRDTPFVPPSSNMNPNPPGSLPLPIPPEGRPKPTPAPGSEGFPPIPQPLTPFSPTPAPATPTPSPGPGFPPMPRQTIPSMPIPTPGTPGMPNPWPPMPNQMPGSGGQPFPPMPNPMRPQPGTTFPPMPNQMPGTGNKPFPPMPNPMPGTPGAPFPPMPNAVPPGSGIPFPPQPNPMAPYPGNPYNPAPFPLTPNPVTPVPVVPNSPQPSPAPDPGPHVDPLPPPPVVDNAPVPFMVPPLPQPPVASQPSLPVVPPGGHGRASPDALTRPVSHAMGHCAMQPPEPYVVYEGPRSAAEMKEECIHCWVQASYLHWWYRRTPVPALVTVALPGGTGVVGDPLTTVRVGGGLPDSQYSGAQVSAGVWCDPEHLWSLEVSGFVMPRHGSNIFVESDTGGTPLIGRPLLTPTEGVTLVSSPGTIAGNIRVRSGTNIHGAEINLGRNIYRCDGWSFDYLLGIRYAYLNDDLNIVQSSTDLGGGVLAFPNVGALPAGSTVTLRDSYAVTNRFFGGQVGGRVGWTHSCFDASISGKVALGATGAITRIDGYSQLTTGGTTTAAVVQGVLVQPRNIGQFFDRSYSTLSEFDFSVGYCVCPQVRLVAGYSVLLWTRVQRAGNQIDRQVNLTQVPTSATFAGGNVGDPVYPRAYSTFSAQGIHLGIEFRY